MRFIELQVRRVQAYWNVVFC